MPLMSLTTDECTTLRDNIIKTVYTLQIMTESMCTNRICSQCPLNFPHSDGCFLVRMLAAISLAPKLDNALIALRSECKHAKER